MSRYLAHATAMVVGFAGMASADVIASDVIASDAINIVSEFGGTGVFSGNVDVTEYMTGPGEGRYDVTNNTNGFLIGLGVTNNGTNPVLFGQNEDGETVDTFGCKTPEIGFLLCYESLRLTENNWATETAFEDFSGAASETYTFAELFGDFEDVAGGDDTINWYREADGALEPGDTMRRFFGFTGLQPASNVIGALGDGGQNTAFFTAGEASAPPAIPLPAGGWLLLAGIGGLAAVRRAQRA